MSLTATERRHVPSVTVPHETRAQLEWLGAGLLVAFAVPFVFADLLDMPRDLYLAVYVPSVAGLFGAWVRTRPDPRALLLRRWPWGIALGLATAGLIAFMVVRSEDAGPRPAGLELAGTLLWRGVLYGAADGVLISVFPILVTVAAFGGLHGRTRRRALTLAAALACSLVFTAVYHAGYSDFRSGKVARPMSGDLVWSVPTLATMSPLGTPIAHIGAHVSAVLHNNDTDLYLPPHD